MQRHLISILTAASLGFGRMMQGFALPQPKRVRHVEPVRKVKRARYVDRSKITTIHQAMRAGGVAIAVRHPWKYRHSSWRAV